MPMTRPAVRHAVPRIIGERQFGAAQYLRDRLRGHWGEELAFNGQPGRQRLFLDLARAIRFDEIIETGTFRGDTTAFMARRTGLPVFTCESSPRHFGYSQARFAFSRKIRIAHSDSRIFLRAHLGGEDDDVATTFAYLDAHWGTDLPLFAETRILLARSARIVVMIDDFEVPDDPGYGFDSYGPAATLNLDYLRLTELPAVQIFFPALRSIEEGGARRGCVVLAQEGPMTEAVATLESLRRWIAR